MIGVFAKMFGPRERVTEIAEADGGLQVKARADAGVETASVAADAPPEAFVEKMEYEGGNVYVIPFMEAFRAWVKRSKSKED